jgi:mono/diheme cytochrome c family protein
VGSDPHRAAAFVFPAVGDPGYDACATQHESRRYRPHARPAIDKRKRIAMKVSASIALAATAAAVLAAATLLPRAHAESQIDRGKYLVTLAGCNDCHTPGYFFGKPDMARYLGGSEVAQAARRPHAGADHALPRVFLPDEGRRARHRRLSAEHPAGQE